LSRACLGKPECFVGTLTESAGFSAGDHHGFDDVNTYFDYFDAAFDRLHTTAFPLGWANGGSGAGEKMLLFLVSISLPSWYDTTMISQDRLGTK
jgi:hypothetical protein